MLTITNFKEKSPFYAKVVILRYLPFQPQKKKYYNMLGDAHINNGQDRLIYQSLPMITITAINSC